MTNIWRLPPEVISRIAAGEVVERPMNIVKELIENSIDAESTKIVVEITNGGLDGVQVQDNGVGIAADDVITAFQLHTTSKLKDDQIGNVLTLGFRGEALASIAAVSLVECSSVHDGTQTLVELEGGTVRKNSAKSTNLGNGTTMRITSLFFNTPARKKFLKQAATERKKIMELVTHFCLSYPEIHFILNEITSAGKSQLRLESPSRTGLLPVIFDIMGAEIANSIVPVKGKLTNWDVSGYVSKPNMVKSDRSTQYLCVNGRVIRNLELQSRIELAYGSQLMKSSFPIIILKLHGASNLVDFNIHPQKAEIRFQSDDPILDEIEHLVSQSLTTESDLQYLPQSQISRVKPNSSQKQISSIHTQQALPKQNQATPRKFYQTSLVDNPQHIAKSGVVVLGHIMNKFAIVDSGDGELWLVDVHAADERIKFEHFSQSTHRKVLSQQMLEPFSMEFLPTEKSILIDNIDHLEKFGLKISDGTSNAILIHSLPVYFDQVLTQERIRKLLDDIISFLSDTTNASSLVESPFDTIEYGIVARLACHGSIRSGYAVSNDVISRVVDKLLSCENPWTCAHGRPTVLKLSKSTLEGWFKR